jgi:nitrate reductase NapA
MTRRVRQLHQAASVGYVELNGADAARLGIVDGDIARVSSRRGTLDLEARVDGRGRPPEGTIFIPFFDENRLANVLTLDAMDNISKEPDYKKCAVSVTRLGDGQSA